jgi:hypothetical protein
MPQLHLFDDQPVVAFQVRCTGTVDVNAAQADQLTMHGKVVMVMVGTIDEGTHKTNKNGDIVRIGTVRVADGAFATDEMAATLIEMYHLDDGQQEFELLMTQGPPEADPLTGEIVIPVAPPKDAALAQYLQTTP